MSGPNGVRCGWEGVKNEDALCCNAESRAQREHRATQRLNSCRDAAHAHGDVDGPVELTAAPCGYVSLGKLQGAERRSGLH